jgi:hypothetical protein
MWKYLALLGLILMGCSSQYTSAELRDMGYKDGYIVGYGITCNMIHTLAHDIDSKVYQASYYAGYNAGAKECMDSQYRSK